ncbi:MAG TPA: DedA family protein [Candidatus Saccharimonadales bacterium]|nr:DedA family protein [Candidatus Saccharimonadales bacterium]
MEILLNITSLFYGIIKGTASVINGLIYSYGYLGVFLLMLLESASLPIPSEIILPAAGLLAAKGVFNVYLVFVVVLAAGVIGVTIDYYIAYYLGKEALYGHIRRLRVKKEHLEAFDEWFARNGAFTVFIGRLLPEVRGLVSLPAGFAAMPKKKFYAYSVAGMGIWDVALLTFGYYALNAHNIYIVMVAVAIFAIVIYALFRVGTRQRKR